FCIYYSVRPEDRVKMEVLEQTPGGEPVRDLATNQLKYRPMLDEDGEPTGEPIYDADKNYIFKEERDRYGNVLKRPIYRDEPEQNQPDYVREVRWVKVPKRDRDYRDPLGQCFYRRLSLTEQAVQTTPLSSPQYFPLVQAKLTERRQNYAGEIPIDFSE